MNYAYLIRLLFSIIISSFLCVNLLFAQKNIFIKVEYIMPEGGFSQTQEAIIDQLITEFQARGYKIGKHPDWRILVDIYHLDDSASGKVIISYTILKSLPKQIIEFGAKNQVFYLLMDEKEDGGEKNQQIREHLSAEYLQQFSMIVNNKLQIVKGTELEKTIKTIVEDIDSQIGKY